MIGYEGIDVNGVRLHSVVIANYSKLTHSYEQVRNAAKDYLIKQATIATKNGSGFVEPGLFFVSMNDDVKQHCNLILAISGVTDDWETRFTPDDLVCIFLGTETEPSIIDQLNYPKQAKQTKEALANGLSYELQALITCMFLTENGDYDTAKTMIESLTPDQLDVIIATKSLLTKRANGDTVKSTKQLAELAGVSEETATKVLTLIK